MSIYIIEHLEPELFPWCILEYKSISKIVGKNNVWFTNIQKKDVAKLSKYGKVFVESVKELPNPAACNTYISKSSFSKTRWVGGRGKEQKLNKKSICILDPEAPRLLSPKEKFDFFVFGGILGDNPPRKRTQPELSRFFPEWEKRNIGKAQFSTDNAVFVVHEIEKGKKFEKMKFQDVISIKTGKYDSVELPYLYPLVNNKGRISRKLVSYIKKHPAF